MKFLLVVLYLIPMAFAQSPCTDARSAGDSSCNQSGSQRFYFDKKSSRCQPFYFKGCNGSLNNFASRAECEQTCSGNQQHDVAASSPGSSGTSGVCASGAYAAGATLDTPTSCSSCPQGYACENNLCCPQKAYLCGLNYDAGRFSSVGKHTPRYFFNKDYGSCMLFTFYGKAGNPNNFATYNECMNFCSDKN
ncbi:unnamed protein product [Auanema sp. JU1783]|nr:unnamed protein product [Auanema sp. JU1783]